MPFFPMRYLKLLEPQTQRGLGAKKFSMRAAYSSSSSVNMRLYLRLRPTTLIGLQPSETHLPPKNTCQDKSQLTTHQKIIAELSSIPLGNQNILRAFITLNQHSRILPSIDYDGQRIVRLFFVMYVAQQSLWRILNLAFFRRVLHELNECMKQLNCFIRHMGGIKLK